jgi:hypothetical protein
LFIKHQNSISQMARGPFSLQARTTAAPRTTRPVALTSRQDRRHLWQAKRATFHLRHDERVQKGAPHRLNSYPFLLSLSLSFYRDQERGYFERDPSPRRKRAPSPPTDQGFEGWPLEGFDSRPRACRARDDSGYVRYMAEARATLPRYPRTFLRPTGAIL